MDHPPFLTACLRTGDEPAVDPAQPLVPWWSFTKTALAAGALRLVAEQRLSLDERIPGLSPGIDRPYSLRQLLQHRAGVPNYGRLAAYHDAVARGDAPWSVEELLQRVAADRLDFAPGKGWAYSNVGYLFVRQMIERASGGDMESSLRRLLFDPLGLRSVRLARTAGDLVDTAWDNRRHYDPGWVYHGLLFGTPVDAAHFLDRLLRGRILPAELLAVMTDPHPLGGPLKGRPWRTTGYGLGLMIGEMEAAGLAIGHSGAGPGSVSAVYHFPEQAPPRTVAVFAQGDDEGVVEQEAARVARADR
jgi:CubicO group peptidase (beta-lactamase class C family)